MDATPNAYPLAFDVDYPDALNRVTTGFRFILVIPLVILLALLVLRHKYPRWWFDFGLALIRLEARITSYFFLLRDEYPSVDDEQHVHLDVPYPNADPDLNRWLPLVKWLLALPHYIVLFFLDLATWVVAIIAWFAILFTGRYPESLFRFVVNVLRWNLNVAAYAFLLSTDRYPPFQLGP